MTALKKAHKYLCKNLDLKVDFYKTKKKLCFGFHLCGRFFSTTNFLILISKEVSLCTLILVLHEMKSTCQKHYVGSTGVFSGPGLICGRCMLNQSNKLHLF